MNKEPNNKSVRFWGYFWNYFPAGVALIALVTRLFFPTYIACFIMSPALFISGVESLIAAKRQMPHIYVMRADSRHCAKYWKEAKKRKGDTIEKATRLWGYFALGFAVIMLVIGIILLFC